MYVYCMQKSRYHFAYSYYLHKILILELNMKNDNTGERE